MAAAHYFIKDNIKKEIAFDSPDAVLIFFLKDKKDEGELFVKEISSIKIKYNTFSGWVRTVSTENTSSIKNYYSADSFSYLLAPIADVICLLAKFDLLLKLDSLNDGLISKIIHANHYDSKNGEFINITHLAVDRTYKEIRKAIKPSFFTFRKQSKLHRVVYKVLNSFALKMLRCRKDSERLLKQIMPHLHAHT